MSKVRFPFDNADVIAIAATGTVAATIENDMTIIDGATTQATGNRTLNLTISHEVTIGATLAVKTKSAATQTLTFGTGITGPVHTGVAGKTFVALFVYDGTAFLQTAAALQLD